MFRIVERRGLYFLISALTILPSLIFMGWSMSTRGVFLPLSIDYTGGTLWEIRFDQDMPLGNVRQAFVDAGYRPPTLFHVEDDRTVQIKFEAIDEQQKQALDAAIEARLGSFEERSFRTIGPTIGAEVGRAALLAVGVASLLILVYIWLVFRQVLHPFRYGACAVVALIHDVLVTLSFACIMNLIAGWELDALFLTATLTVIGYSVNDTIVVFDRIRENFRRYRGLDMSTLVNRSIVETFQRSLGTVITTLLTLVAILVLGGPTVRQFTAVLVVGIISGMYSSIFTASPMLVAWEERSLLHRGDSRSTTVDGQAATA